jgi:hypothetical protein
VKGTFYKNKNKFKNYSKNRRKYFFIRMFLYKKKYKYLDVLILSADVKGCWYFGRYWIQDQPNNITKYII